ncbi:hypothetical protein An17g00190 [Aspergillus niger]|uniref:Uncharacterized protein n=2 Tax=Aspergillus niger TaxID=5061 RepID=A2R956_ASPNC|nr:hypothetical protein An17g00190 [Aspergillus niger]CAK47147.1 hypothetical protein An17g00190 [Aspergillus niger]
MESREQISDAIPSRVAEALVHDIAKPRAVGDGYHIGPVGIGNVSPHLGDSDGRVRRPMWARIMHGGVQNRNRETMELPLQQYRTGGPAPALTPTLKPEPVQATPRSTSTPPQLGSRLAHEHAMVSAKVRAPYRIYPFVRIRRRPWNLRRTIGNVTVRLLHWVYCEQL